MTKNYIKRDLKYKLLEEKYKDSEDVRVYKINDNVLVVQELGNDKIFVSGESYNDSGATATKSITRTYTVVNGVLT